MSATPARSAPVHPVDEILPPGPLLAYGLQHVLTFYSGAILVPVIVAGALGLSTMQLIHLINADLFTCGIASLIQALGFRNIGVRLPLLQGVTISAVNPMIAIGMAGGSGTPGLLAIYGSVIIAGLFTFFAAPYFSRLVRFFPPVVTGSVILIIGVALLPVAANDIVMGSGPNAIQHPVLPRNLIYAMGTLGLIVLIQRLFSGFLGTIAVLIGLVTGTLVAWAMGDAHFAAVAESDWFGVTLPFYFGIPHFSLTAAISMMVVMVITMVETTGDVYATGEIVGRRIRPDDVARAIRADGLATFIGGVLNSFPYTCFAENVGLVRLTRVKSRWVVVAAALIMLVIGSVPKAAAIVAGVPLPVLGGAALAMFAAVAVVGIQTLGKVDFTSHSNVVIVSSSLGLGMLATTQPYIADTFPSWAQIVFGSGITLGAFTAILLNLAFNHIGNKHDAVAGTPATGQVTLADVNGMEFSAFSQIFGGMAEHSDWLLHGVFARRPFHDVAALRLAFQEVFLAGNPAEKLELMNGFADLGSEADSENDYILAHAESGLHDLDTPDLEQVAQLAIAYRAHFGFPLIVCAREADRYERILSRGWSRLANSPAAELATAQVEIMKIFNYRFEDLVANANPFTSAQAARFNLHGEAA